MNAPSSQAVDKPVRAPVDDDFFAAEVIRDPYSYFGKLRELAPVHWNERHQLWFVTRHDDLVWAAGRPELFSNRVFRSDPRAPYPAVAPADMGLYELIRQFLSQWFVQADPPEHTQMRRAVAGHFSPKAMDAWRPAIQSLLGELLDEVEAKGEMDLVRDFATPMPLLVIAQMLGLPAEDRRYIQDDLGPALLYMSRGEVNRLSMLADGIHKLQEYIGAAVSARASKPGSDLLSALAAGERTGVYTREQVVANAILLLVAGYDTTSSLISNGVLAFIRHPEQWNLLQQAPLPTLKAATEECLRFDSPQKTIQRIATTDINMRGGKVIRKLDRIRLVICSANRDPEKFVDPDKFDILRKPAGHVSFGYGIHHCIGAALARLQTQEAMHALVQRFADLHLAEDRVEYQPSISFRSIKRMRLTWDPR